MNAGYLAATGSSNRTEGITAPGMCHANSLNMAKNISPSSRVGLAANGGAMGGEGGVASGSEETARNGNDGGTGSPMSWAYRGDSTGEAGGRGGGNIHEGGTFAGTPGGGGGSAGGGGQTGGDGARGQAYVTWSD